jgi:hypothetical protein
MRTENMEICLKVNTVPLEEVVIGEKVYAIAEPDQEFTVSVKVHRIQSMNIHLSLGPFYY